MERVAFLLEETGERLGALLNPDTLVVRRVAGVRQRRSTGGPLTGAGQADDPLLYTGGGRTELELDLLFDVALDGSSVATADVQDLTGPLWDLAENVTGTDGRARPRIVRFVWGKAWNIPGVVSAVSERFERFTESGVPQRSWLRMRLLRVQEGLASPRPAATGVPALPDGAAPVPGDIDESELTYYEVVGSESGEVGTGDRLDQIAERFYGDASLWRWLADYNGIVDPLRIPPPRTLVIPPLSALRGTA
jgi:hypothetical protein